MHDRMKKTEQTAQLVLYVHGKGGNAEEAAHYIPLFPDCRVVGLDYTATTPWDAVSEFRAAFDALTADAPASVTLIANSIGAYFSLYALADRRIDRALLISPVTDMERLITDRMAEAGVSERELQERGEIPTAYGDPLSWAYLTWVRTHPLTWCIPTHVLYAGGDTLVARDTVEAFVGKFDASLTVMENGEHWFHTEEQMAFLDGWIRRMTEPEVINHSKRR